MGGLRKFMPITAGTFIVAWLAIAGVVPFAGFWSKDEILLNAYDKSPVLWAVGWITALLTAFYMSRQVFMVFFGKPRFAEVDEHAHPSEGEEAEALSDPETADAPQADEAGHHAPAPHESPWIMTVPLLVLAALSFVGGGINLPFLNRIEWLDRWLEPVFGENQRVVDVATGMKWGLALVALAAALIGILIAYAIYLRRRVPAERVEVAPLNAAVYFDDAISAFVDGPGEAAFNGTAAFDRGVVDGAVNGVGWIVRSGARRLRVVQTGYVRSYALGLAAGAVLLLGFFIARVGV
jgi:NADH-quinone oxidoreductase subunit L